MALKLLDPKTIPYDNTKAKRLGRLQITVVGRKDRPLLTHNPQSLGADDDAAKRGTRIPEPEVEAEAGAYRLEDGTCAIKGEAFREALLGAAGVWKAKGKTTMRMLLTHVVVVEELVALRHPSDRKPIKEYVIDRRPVRINKARVMRHRPRYDEWLATFTLEFDQQIVTEPAGIVDIVADAGARIGIHDNRTKGSGRFLVVEYVIS